MFNTYMRDNLVTKNIDNYCAFIKKFTRPSDSSEDDVWMTNSFPLLVLNLQVNPNKGKKKDKKKKKDEKSATMTVEAVDDEDLPIFYEPSYSQILSTLVKPFEWIIESVNQIFQLEKDLVPLIEIAK